MRCDACGGSMREGNLADGGTFVRRRMPDGSVRAFFVALCKKCLDTHFGQRNNAGVAPGGAAVASEGKGSEGKGRVGEWLRTMGNRLAGR